MGGKCIRRLNKECKSCGKPLEDKNKSGFCQTHMNVGVNNPLYGKHPSQETIAKRTQAIKKRWEDDEFRSEMAKKFSKPRRMGFKEEQSKRMTEWYEDNPEQREIRRESMRKKWEDGVLTKHISRSKIEQKFFADILTICPDAERATLHCGICWVFPDVTIMRDRIVIEFYGDYWHANPAVYEPDIPLHSHMVAKEIWGKDASRVKKIEKLGFTVYIVWELDYKKNRDRVLSRLDNLINWESCNM